MNKLVSSFTLVAAMVYPMAVSAQEIDNTQEVATQEQTQQQLWQNPVFDGIELTEQQKQQLSEIENPFIARGPQVGERPQKDDSREHRGPRKGHGRNERHHQDQQMHDQAMEPQCQPDGQCTQDSQRKHRPGMHGNGQPVQARPGFRPQGFPERQQMMQNIIAARSEYLQKVSQILSPEQYNKMLENMVIYQQIPPRAFRGQDFRPRHQRRMRPSDGPAPQEYTEGVVVGFGPGNGAH